MRKRVLFVINSLGWGGAESQVIDLASRFRSRGWVVSVVSLMDLNDRRDQLLDQGIDVHTLRMSRGTIDPRAIWRLLRVLRDFQPEIVHSHIVHANLLCRVARILRRVPVLISSAHSIDEGSWWRSLAYRLTDSLADLTTNVSKAGVRCSVQQGKVSETRACFVPNGVDVGRFRYNESTRREVRNELTVASRYIWLAVGRMDDSKDYPTMLRAFAEIVDHPSRPILVCVGEGPDFEVIRDVARNLGLVDAVMFLGQRDDVTRLMAAADSYALSSAWEGLPMVLLEASASGLPIVATDVGGVSQIVVDGHSGELVSKGDWRSFATAMRKTMDQSPERRKQTGLYGAKFVRAEFEISHVVDQWEEIYVDLFARRWGR